MSDNRSTWNLGMNTPFTFTPPLLDKLNKTAGSLPFLGLITMAAWNGSSFRIRGLMVLISLEPIQLILNLRWYTEKFETK